MTAVHVLMPVRNAAAFIDASIESCITQTHPDTKLVVLDDASTDETAAIVRSYARVNPDRVHFEQADHWGGTASARNRLIRLSQEIDPKAAFLWLDADDKFTGPEAVSTIMHQMDTTGADICLYGFDMRWQDQGAAMTSNGLGALEDKNRHEALLQRIVDAPSQTVAFANEPRLLEATSLGWTKAYAAPAKRNWAFPAEGRMYEDFPSMAMLLNARKITAIDPAKPIVDYLRRSNSATGDRKAAHFLQDIPDQLDSLLAHVDSTDSAKVAAATEFARAKLDRYDHTLSALVEDHRAGFTPEVLAGYRLRTGRVAGASL